MSRLRPSIPWFRMAPLPSGGVSGAGSSTNTALVRWNGTSGNSLQDSAVILSATVMAPAANDGVALGSATLMWSDLFLASGGVINWNNGDVTITHSANFLAHAGASNGYSFDAEIFPAADDGAALGDATHNFSDLFLASGSVINWVNGDLLLTHTTNTLTLTGGDLVISSAGTASGSVVTVGGVQSLSGKNIAAGQTLLLEENASLGLDPAGSADGKYTGITITAISGYTQAFGDLVYFEVSTSRWAATDANSSAGAAGDSRGLIGIVVVAGTNGNPCTILLHGVIRADAKFPTFTIGAPIYVSETANLVTSTQPTTADVVIRVVGFALTGDEMFFSPSSDYITHT